MPQEGEQEQTGQAPAGEQETENANAGGQAPKTFDEEYVKKLRDEAAGWRTKAQEATSKVQEFEDADKSEKQKLEEKATQAEQAQAAAERKALVYEVAAAKKVPLEQAHRLQGSTKQELEADADEFLKSLGEQDRTSPDGGTRQPVPAGGMDSLIRRSAGRG